MSYEIQQIYERLRATPFPVLGKTVGDFALYDSLLAGCADRAARGEPVAVAEIPIPDSETAACVNELRRKQILGPEERDFLSYFDLLEQMRVALRANRGGHH